MPMIAFKSVRKGVRSKVSCVDMEGILYGLVVLSVASVGVRSGMMSTRFGAPSVLVGGVVRPGKSLLLRCAVI